MEQRYAVLIGANEYPEAGLPELRAPRSDVAGWFKLLRRLGVPARNIRVLTSPSLTPDELECDEAVCGDATTGAVDAAIGWLGQRLADGGSLAWGLVFFSGHGGEEGGVPFGLLEDFAGHAGPADAVATGGRLDERRAEQTLAEQAPQASIVCIWDTCRRDAAMLSAAPPPNVVSIATARGGEDAYERCFGGQWRGQFTWAALTLLEQWPHQAHRGLPYVAISHTVLAHRVAELLHTFAGPVDGISLAAFDDLVARRRAEWASRYDGGAVPALRALAELSADLHAFLAGGNGQRPDVRGDAVLAGKALFVPFSFDAPVARSAREAPVHEFPTGTTEFRTPNGPFGKAVVTTSGILYTFASGWVDTNGRVTWPSGFDAVFMASGSNYAPSGATTWACAIPMAASGLPTGWSHSTADGKVRTISASGHATTWGIALPSGASARHLFQNLVPSGLVPSGTTLHFATPPAPAPPGTIIVQWTDK